jgi:ketosteroid isomerase-like protein
MIRSFWTVCAFVALLTACDRQEPMKPTQPTAASDEKAFTATTGAFHETLRQNDVTGFMSYIDDNAIVAPPGEQPVRGKHAVEQWYKDFLRRYRTSSLELTGKEVFVGDRWAAEFGSFTWGLTPADRSAPIVDHGTYMQVWRRQPDGTWRFAREVWNSSPAASIKTNS